MSTLLDRPSRARAGARRMLLSVVVAVAVAVVVLAIVLLTLSGSPAGGTSNDGSIPYPDVLSGQSVPTDEDVLSPTEQACQLARVAGC